MGSALKCVKTHGRTEPEGWSSRAECIVPAAFAAHLPAGGLRCCRAAVGVVVEMFISGCP